VVRAVHCPFVGASVSEYHNSIVADFLAQASTANRLVCSDSGGIDRPLPCAGVFEQYSTGRKIFLRQARSFGRWARSARALGTCRRWVPARLRHNDIVFRFAGEILKLRGGKSPASAAWGENAARPSVVAVRETRRDPIVIAASVGLAGMGGLVLSLQQ